MVYAVFLTYRKEIDVFAPLHHLNGHVSFSVSSDMPCSSTRAISYSRMEIQMKPPLFFCTHSNFTKFLFLESQHDMKYSQGNVAFPLDSATSVGVVHLNAYKQQIEFFKAVHNFSSTKPNLSILSTGTTKFSKCHLLFVSSPFQSDFPTHRLCRVR